MEAQSGVDARSGAEAGSGLDAESRVQARSRVEGEDRKPLFRDELPGDSAATAAPRGHEPDDATTILPKTTRRAVDPDDIDEPSRGQRGRTALLVGAVTAVVILGLAIGYAVFSLNDPKTANQPAPTASGTGTSAATDPSSIDASVLLTDELMMTAADAKLVDPKRTWKVALTQKGLDDESPQAACLGGEPAEGQPTPRQTVLRLLSSSGAAAPGILHQADAYETPEEAAQAFVLTSKALGGCSMAATSIESGQTVAGLGDQALSLILRIDEAGGPEYRNVMLSRTGRVVNVVDVAQKKRALVPHGLLAALAKVVNVQCETSGGECAAKPGILSGPPPVGGDQPGFLATADLPPVGEPARTWVADIPTAPSPDFTGSGCEVTRFDKVDAKSARARTYLLEDVPGVFGLDEVVLTMKTAKAARALAKDLKAEISGCKTRKLTATVSQPQTVAGRGAKAADISGWTTTVTQSTSAVDKSTYRVGVAVSGAKIAYLFLSTDLDKKLNTTDADWNRLTVRAGQRATQVN
ncbi:MAG TPA: hypothetical protein VFP89_12585 [Propionibacteriaceae bacterium]|nr:hypothetical protein [Propionibacteriaceae bacterium]